MGGITIQARQYAREALKAMTSVDSGESDQSAVQAKDRGKGCECMMPCSWFMANLMAERKIPQGARGRAREI